MVPRNVVVKAPSGKVFVVSYYPDRLLGCWGLGVDGTWVGDCSSLSDAMDLIAETIVKEEF